MVENNKNKAPTHTAFAFKPEGRKFGRWLEIGVACAEENGQIRVSLDRLPTGGFRGRFLLSPIGTVPEVPLPPPRRPGEGDDDDPLDS
jgi:hypothetical protein